MERWWLALVGAGFVLALAVQRPAGAGELNPAPSARAANGRDPEARGFLPPVAGRPEDLDPLKDRDEVYKILCRPAEYPRRLRPRVLVSRRSMSTQLLGFFASPVVRAALVEERTK